MRSHVLLLADSAQALEGKLYVLGGAWDQLNVAEFPTQHLTGIAVGIDVEWTETNERHKLVISVQDADGHPVDGPRIEVDFETGRPPGAAPGVAQRVVFAVNGPLNIPAPGGYAVVLEVNGNELGRTQFRAVQRPRP